jgi:hypothetical protein
MDDEALDYTLDADELICHATADPPILPDHASQRNDKKRGS